LLGFPAALVKDQLATATKISQIETPILIMHDRDDGSIPVAQGERLAVLAKGAKLLLFSGYGHQLGFAAEAQQAGLAWLAGLQWTQS
jgi:pimeloyl-ACP methyl ester carboxylesterase